MWRRRTRPLGVAQQVVGHGGEVLVGAQLAAPLDELQHLVDEPRVVAGQLADAVDAPSRASAPRRRRGAGARWGRRSFPQRVVVDLAGAASAPNPTRAVLEAAQRLVERLLEGAADRHDLADRLHPGGERVVGAGNFSNANRGILVTT
jgi:hypothetical protein